MIPSPDSHVIELGKGGGVGGRPGGYDRLL